MITISRTITEEPLTLAKAKLHCRIDNDLEDEFLLDAITAATVWAEEFTGLLLGRGVFVYDYDKAPTHNPAPLDNATFAVLGTGKTRATFVGGYGLTCPRDVLAAIKMLVDHLYNNRGDASAIQMHQIPMGVRDLLRQKRNRLGMS